MKLMPATVGGLTWDLSNLYIAESTELCKFFGKQFEIRAECHVDRRGGN